MGYIYKITNSVNDKVYIGQTIDTLSNRFSKHKYEAINYPNNKSSLHAAMRKYGVDKFSIVEIEQCDNENLNEREKYWIEYFNSYNDKSRGYNNTIGGDGNLKYNSLDFLKLWQEGKTLTQIGDFFGTDRHVVKKHLLSLGIKETELIKNKFGNAKKGVIQIDRDSLEIINEFESLTQAANAVGGCVGGISSACNGKRKTYLNYIWKYKNI